MCLVVFRGVFGCAGGVFRTQFGFASRSVFGCVGVVEFEETALEEEDLRTWDQGAEGFIRSNRLRRYWSRRRMPVASS